MKIVYGKTLTAEETRVVNNIASECGILFDTARLLFCRNIDTVQKAKAFLNPGKHAFNDPFLLGGMADAVNRIKKAKDLGESVLIFGDYDADGVCATTVLYYTLKDFGITARKFVPEREDNYGLNLNTISEFNKEQKIDLLISVDCGISDGEKIKELERLGIDVIVTDHHEPPEVLPECIKINPKIPGQRYPFKELCGAGVAYKLGYALVGEKANEYLDFVALATVPDSMDLVEENRDIVVEGLKLFNDKNRLKLPFKNIIGDANKQITAQTLAYTIAPRINAGGRMGDAATALKLFTCEDAVESFDLAVKLENYNTMRQAECDKIYREARQKIIDQKADNDSIILVADEGWKTGFIGIVAAKLVEEFARPVIVFAGCDGYFKGSARSVEGFNVYDAICSVKDLLLTYGGHSQAAGVSVSIENFEKLKSELNLYAGQLKNTMDTEQKIYAEWEILEPISLRFAKELDLLEPCGVSNRKPLFITSVSGVDSNPLKVGSPHYAFKTSVFEMLDFNGERNVALLSFPIEKKVVFEVNLSTYKNKESLKGYVKGVYTEYEESEQNQPYYLYNDLEIIASGKARGSIHHLDELSVDREDFKRVFSALKNLSGKYFKNAVQFAKKYLGNENVYQSIFVIKVFIELGIFSIVNNKFVFNENEKNALTNSKLYSKIYSLKVDYD